MYKCSRYVNSAQSELARALRVRMLAESEALKPSLWNFIFS